MASTDSPVRLYTKQLGEGPSLVILHGLFGSWENWRSHAQQLSDDFKVTLMDLRNHGQSEHRDTMNYPAMAADVATTCHDLGIDQTHVLGHSMGGKVAMQLAVDFPTLVERTIVVDIGPGKYPPNHQQILTGMSLLAQHSIQSRKQADDLLSEFEANKGIRSFLLKNLQKDHTKDQENGYQLRLNLKAIVEQYDHIADAISVHHNTATTDPKTASTGVLFIKGENSDYLQEKDRESILSIFPSARVKVVANTGHWLHTEKPALVQKIIREFLAS